MSKSITAQGLTLQKDPPIAVLTLSGHWLLDHCTPSWRIRDPEKGFQRVVNESRARQIAVNVLDQQRTFPSAIVLATNVDLQPNKEGDFAIANSVRFLIVDGQHRLWAQKFSDFEASYACIVHSGLDEIQMARLFLEINDNQRRVPSSLRWDLVRLVQPEDDQPALLAAELVYDLATMKESPLYQRIDLTGEQGEIVLKQGSVAPEIRSLVTSKKPTVKALTFDNYYDALTRYLAAIQSVDPDGWRSGKSPLISARVLRALFRLLVDIAEATRKPAHQISAQTYFDYLSKIDIGSLSREKILAMQAAAGVKQIHQLLMQQIGLA